MDHHPEITNVYDRRGAVALTTHDAGDRVTETDLELARRIDASADEARAAGAPSDPLDPRYARPTLMYDSSSLDLGAAHRPILIVAAMGVLVLLLDAFRNDEPDRSPGSRASA